MLPGALLRHARLGSLSMRNIVAVIGTTGVGKSQLAVSLAKTLSPGNALVLSADSMQLYKGLDAITNKVKVEEQGGVEHWGLDMVQPGKGDSWEVGKWCGEADRVVQELPEDRLSILCGGTHYFIQHFLFPPSSLQFSTERQAGKSVPANASASNVKWTPPCALPSEAELPLPAGYRELLETFWTAEPAWPLPSVTAAASAADTYAAAGPSRPSVHDPQQLLCQWKLLELIDPSEAQRWHWKDGRKVKRGIERWWERLASSPSPSKTESQARSEVKARFRTLIFWVYDSLENLRPRLDARVDRMVENGLLREVQQLRDVAKAAYGHEDGIGHEEGIFQAIGYKEFAGLGSPLSARDPGYGAALERTKISTHQYAKSQLQWIRKQLLPVVRDVRAGGAQVYVYVVPGGLEGEALASEILTAFLARSASESESEMPERTAFGSELLDCLDEIVGASGVSVPGITRRQQLNARRECAECSQALGEPVSVLASEWEAHGRGKGHVRNVNALWKQRDPEGWLENVKARSAAKAAARSRPKDDSKVD